MYTLQVLCSTLLIISSCNCFRDLQFRKPGYYTIAAPGTIRSNSNYQMSISLGEFHEPCFFNISIYTPGSSDRYPTIHQFTKINPETTTLVGMDIPKLSSGQGRLHVVVFGGIYATEEGRLNVEERHYSVFIQTNKAKYRPGDVMRFRLICIDRLTRPARVVEQLNIHVYDGQKNLIKQFSDIKLVQGVFKGDLHLSEYPVLGEWNIEVQSDGLTMQEKSFQVARYILPAFSVEISTKHDIAVEENQIVLTIKAFYTYGKPVKGDLKMELRTIYSAFEEQYPGFVRETKIDGETTIYVDLKTDLNIKRNASGSTLIRLFKLSVEISVEDSLTREFSQGKTEISIHRRPYKLKIDGPETFNPGDAVKIMVKLTDLQDNPIEDKNNSVTIAIVGGQYKHKANYNFPISTPVNKFETVFVNSDGVGIVSFNLTDESFVDYTITAIYLGLISHSRNLKTNVANTFELNVLTERPEVGKDFLIQLKSSDSIDHFVYDIVSRGNIIKSEYIKVSENLTTYNLQINAVHAMVPKITIFVYRAKGRQFDSRLKEVYIKREFQNSIKINTDSLVKPGALVSINITTDEGSYVGLMGVDQKLLLDTKSSSQLTEDQVYTELQNFDSLSMSTQMYPAIQAGLLIFSNTYNRAGFQIGKISTPLIVGGSRPHPLAKPFSKPSVELPQIRKLFSETWIFKDFERTPIEGIRFHEIIPDTITSWAITGFSLNPDTGLTLTNSTTQLIVFQEFFISMDLPSLVKEGEIVEITIYVLNYLNQDVLTNVTIDKDSDDLEVLSKEDTAQATAKTIHIQSSAKFVFLVRPRKPGQYNITATAISSIASDAVQKTLNVDPEGVRNSKSNTYLVHFREESEQEDEILLEIPEISVAGSEKIHLSVVGDVFEPLTRSLKNLARVPYGSGEDNIKYFISNVLVLKYLKALNYTNPSLERRSKLNLELGYQTQLNFKQLDGSFSRFDRATERTGDTWLTAYVMWGFHQARHYIQVDSKVLERGLDYLKSKQGENGGYTSGNGLEMDVSLTVFSLLAFMEQESIQPKFKGVIRKGLEFLFNNLDNLNESIASPALATYALALGKHQNSEETLTKLFNRAELPSKPIAWTKSDTLQSNLETTASNLFNLVSENEPTKAILPIVRALITPGQGDTSSNYMVALDAMISIAQKMEFGSKNLDIHFSADGIESGDIHVGLRNAQVLQTVRLPNNVKKIRLKAKGTGHAVVDIKYSYNLVADHESLSDCYLSNLTVTESTEYLMVLDVCTARSLANSSSNITAMEVHLQSGYMFIEKTFDEVKNTNNRVMSIQNNGNEASILVYMENVTSSGICVQLETRRSYNVFNAKPVSVVVYDVFQEDQRSISFHNTSNSGLQF